MSPKRIALALCCVTAASLFAQQTPGSDEPIRIGPGVTPPRLLRKVEPEFTPEALAAQVQGIVVLEIVISAEGRVTDISVLSPLGYGLDEQAQAAVSKWKFAPGEKDGKPVRILATVQVTFRLLDRVNRFSEKAERQRTDYNVAVQAINQTPSNPQKVDRAVKTMLDLAKRKYAPALYLVGNWKLKGEHVAQGAAEGLEFIQRSAQLKYDAALYDVALRHLEGRGLPRDTAKGYAEMRAAAAEGNHHAQYFMGTCHANGNGVPLDLGQARRYYGLCAAQGVALCQYRLGRLLYDAPKRRERDYLRAVALFQLAAELDLPEAKELAAKESPALTADQAKWVANLKAEIVRK
jgi:TonB family protein